MKKIITIKSCKSRDCGSKAEEPFWWGSREYSGAAEDKRVRDTPITIGHCIPIGSKLKKAA